MTKIKLVNNYVISVCWLITFP